MFLEKVFFNTVTNRIEKVYPKSNGFLMPNVQVKTLENGIKNFGNSMQKRSVRIQPKKQLEQNGIEPTPRAILHWGGVITSQ